MVDHIFSNDSAKIAIESSKKDQQDEIIKDNYLRLILNATHHLPMKVIRTDQDIMEFLED